MEIDFAVLGIVLGFSGSSEAYLGPSEGVLKEGQGGWRFPFPRWVRLGLFWPSYVKLRRDLYFRRSIIGGISPP